MRYSKHVPDWLRYCIDEAGLNQQDWDIATSLAHGADKAIWDGGRGGALIQSTPLGTLITIMFVDPSAQCTGVGKALVNRIIKNDKTGVVYLNPYTSEAEVYFQHIGFVKDEDFDPNDTNTLIFKHQPK